LSADPDCCSFTDRKLNRFSAGVVDAEVDGVAVLSLNQSTEKPDFNISCNLFRFEINVVSITITFHKLCFPFVFRFRFTNHFHFPFTLT